MHPSPETRRIAAAAVVLLLSAVAVGGCALFSSDTKPFIVKDSQLNWLEVCYFPGAGQPAVKLSLMGSGLIRIMKGASPQVGNDFSQDVANVRWNDVKVDQINVQPAEMRGVFQAFVDRGVLREPDKDFVASANRGVPVARITGTLGYEHVVRIAVEPELTGFVRELLKVFDEGRTSPAPGR
jgi:hypothetical protein